jgi:DNA-binding ferritin-like protein
MPSSVNLRRVTVLGVVLVLAAMLAGCGGSGSSVLSNTRGPGDRSGSPLDATNGGGGGNTAEAKALEDVDKAEEALARDPEDTDALATLTRSHYALANLNTDAKTNKLTSAGLAELQKSAEAWEQYLSATPQKVDQGLARVAIQSYATLAQTTGDPEEARRYWRGAAEAAKLIATAQSNPQNFIQLVQFATLAGDMRTAELAGQTAIDLAPSSQKAEVRKAVEQAKSADPSEGGAGKTPATPSLPGQ